VCDPKVTQNDAGAAPTQAILAGVRVTWYPRRSSCLISRHMTNRDSGTLSSSSCGNPLILRAQIRLLGSRSGLGSLHQDRFDPMIALANTSAEPFTTTLVVARADSDQRGEVSSIGERRHIPADLGKQDLNASPIQARDGIRLLDQRIIGAQTLLDLVVQPDNGLVVVPDHLQELS
jgi:hypothetical protein